ncbi:uncharacterized protein LOC120695198 [Panicum virgatum]|uniref:uncharacterized protein LOC120695198 n=1 Tax=Panicum virgatum TaxID=38727 RepID=UPI0019D69AF6|nr:uncharacterized protein LOC120695198 [Panicum virgatum]
MPSAMVNVKVTTTRGGKTTQDLPYPNLVNRKKTSPVAEEPPQEEEPEMVHEWKTAPHEFYDTKVLPFPMRAKKPSTDEQFSRFVEMIQQVNINVPLMDAMMVPTYARYIKDIINNKRPLLTMEVIKLTEACSVAILHQLPEKKKDPGFPTIRCSIGAQNFDKALCDLGASVSVMPKAVFDQLNYTELTPTPMQLQLADSSVRHPEGITGDVPVRVRDCFVLVNFMVLNMDNQKKTTLILGRPFLNTADAHIDVRAGEIRLHINGKEEKFDFRSKKEQCLMIRVKFWAKSSENQRSRIHTLLER